MDIKLDYSITIDEFLEMVESVGWKTYSKEQAEKACSVYGAADRGRTDTVSLPQDFESSASASSTTSA